MAREMWKMWKMGNGEKGMPRCNQSGLSVCPADEVQPQLHGHGESGSCLALPATLCTPPGPAHSAHCAQHPPKPPAAHRPPLNVLHLSCSRVVSRSPRFLQSPLTARNQNWPTDSMARNGSPHSWQYCKKSIIYRRLKKCY